MMGLAAGNWLPTMSMLISANFGLASYGAIFGSVDLARSIGAAIGSLMAGFIYMILPTPIIGLSSSFLP